MLSFIEPGVSNNGVSHASINTIIVMVMVMLSSYRDSNNGYHSLRFKSGHLTLLVSVSPLKNKKRIQSFNASSI